MKYIFLLLLYTFVWGQYDSIATQYNMQIYRINEGYVIDVDDTIQGGDEVHAIFTTDGYNPPYQSPYTRFLYRTEVFLNTESMWEDTTAHIYFTADYPAGDYEFIINALAVSEFDTMYGYGADAMYLRVDTSDVSLSVDLTFFEAVLIDGHVSLSWITNGEVNNCGYNLYKREHNGLDSKITKMPIPGEGNSANRTTYGTVDKNVQPGKSYIYTLESLSCDGEHSVEGKVSIYIPVVYGISLSHYPNPTNGSSVVEYSIDERSEVELTLYDVRGGRIASIFKGIQPAGSYAEMVEVNNIASGTYFYFLRAHNVRTMTVKVLSEKLLVIK